jgi:ubiquinone/menaquinone biosynthesis C-methylase UbiE
MNPSSPQWKEMADESMVRNLATEMEAIWAQEEPIFTRDPPPSKARVLDVGCGTGELAPPLLRLFPDASYLGVDLEEPHLEKARARCKALGERARFARDDAMDLSLSDGEFDLAVSRHVLQAVPDAAKAVSEMVRVLKPGGRLHLIAEDYGMLWSTRTGSGSASRTATVPRWVAICTSAGRCSRT